jgi:hypothetical protein
VTMTRGSCRPLPLMLLGLWACGGVSTASGLYSGGGAEAGGADAGTTPRDAGTASGDANTHHKTKDGGGTTESGDAGVDAPSGSDVSTITPPVDAFVGAPDVGTSNDTGTTAPPTACQSSTDCSNPDPTCCATFNTGGAPTGECVASTSVCQGAGGAPVACDTSAQCTGEDVCCATGGLDGFSEVSCAATCQGIGEYELCDPSAHPSGCSIPGQQCMQYGQTGYGYCSGNGQGQH